MKQRDMSQPNFTKPERKAYQFRVLPTGALILKSGAMYARDERGSLRKIVVNKGRMSMIEVPITECHAVDSVVEVTSPHFPRGSRIPLRINPAITITYDEWCKQQADRINHSGGHARVKYSRENKVMMCEVVRPPTEVKRDGEEDEA